MSADGAMSTRAIEQIDDALKIEEGTLHSRGNR
jgi:hypothetical protein